ncbi:MAG: TonB-dependent receptor, partial [Bacteroidetes bacterium]|nr:TonB-dependent receptor [Bacteroidota bacterium]
NILDYKQDFGNHSLGATLIAGRNKIEFDRTRVEGTGFDNLDLGHHSIPQAAVQSVFSNGYEETFSYQMGRLTYDYKDKYFLTGTIRRDGYSGFAENEKIGYFPSVGLSWVISEDFNFEETFIDRLKLRTSYGSTGNLTSRFQSLAIVQATPFSQYIFGDGGSTVNGQTPTSLANPNLTWETTNGLNFGLDFSLWDYRINGSIDYYNSQTTNLLWEQILPEVTGFNAIQTNLGKIANSGLEIILDAQIIKPTPSGFSWDLGFNFSTNKNEIKELLGFDIDGDGKEDDLISSGLFIGESIGAQYNYDIQGIWQIDEESNIPSPFTIGSYKLNDISNDGTIDSDDRKIIGRTDPAYSFGIQNTLKYNNFTLKFFINSVQGGKNGYLGRDNPGRDGSTFEFNMLNGVDYWSPINPNAQFHGLGVSNPLPASQYFSRSFVRLQDVSFSYNFDTSDSWMQSIGVKGLKLYISGKNLITLTDWLGWDPETGIGLEGSSGRPLMKSITTGLQVNF